MTGSGADHGHEWPRNGGGHAFQEKRSRKREGRGRRDSGDTDATDNYGSRDGESDSEPGGKLAPGWGVGRGINDCPGEVAVWPEGQLQGSSEVMYHAGTRRVLGKRELLFNRVGDQNMVPGLMVGQNLKSGMCWNICGVGFTCTCL